MWPRTFNARTLEGSHSRESTYSLQTHLCVLEVGHKIRVANRGRVARSMPKKTHVLHRLWEVISAMRKLENRESNARHADHLDSCQDTVGTPA